MKHFKWKVLLFIVVLAGCQEEPPEYNTPEATLRAYQSFIDNNAFDSAKALSTPAEQRRLETMARIVFEDELDSTLLSSRFLKLNCQEQGDTAYCFCQIEDQYEEYEENYRLIRIDGQWHVDAPDEEIIIENEMLQEE